MPLCSPLASTDAECKWMQEGEKVPGGMAGGKADPAALMRAYIEHDRLQDAAQVAVHHLGAWHSKVCQLCQPAWFVICPRDGGQCKPCFWLPPTTGPPCSSPRAATGF